MSLCAESILSVLKPFIGSSNTAKPRCWLAYSGGLDSTVLLHLLTQLRSQLSADLRAIHINHQLSDHSESWVAHCKRQCDVLEIPIEVRKVDIEKHAHLGIEGAARQARYQVFESIVEPSDLLLTAHHRDDQIETLFLQLLRGSGPHGLAAMPKHRTIGSGTLFRPLLDFDRIELEAYAQQEKLLWIEDDSNLTDKFDRNYLRNQIIPLFKARWPSLTKVGARVIEIQAEQTELADELAEIDLKTVEGQQPTQVSISKLLEMSEVRQSNVLRYWIRLLGYQVPSVSVLKQVRAQMLSAQEDRMPLVAWDGCELRRYRDALFIMSPLATDASEQSYSWSVSQSLHMPEIDLTLDRKALVELGVDLELDEVLQVRFRQGGESCKQKGHVETKTVKQLFQEFAIPPWQRSRIPLIYRGNSLIAIWGCCACQDES